jgi:hypothetical protein
MTEHEWRTSTSPVALLAHLNADGYGRQVLLYASALRHLRPGLLTNELAPWVDLVERVLVGAEPAKALDGLQEEAEDWVSHYTDVGPAGARGFYSVLSDAVYCTWTSAPTEYETDLPAAELEPIRRRAAGFVRDIFGNPFRRVSFSPQWRTDTAVSLARQMYESRDFSAMPILADALQDAGCENEDVLNHCRAPHATHVRGCWVCDLVLAAESVSSDQ